MIDADVLFCCDCFVTFQESRIAEALFLPPKPVPKKQLDEDESNHGGSRISARQQQKRERALQKKREKEAAEALLGTKSTKLVNPASTGWFLLTSHCFSIRREQEKEEATCCSENYHSMGPNMPSAKASSRGS